MYIPYVRSEDITMSTPTEQAAQDINNDEKVNKYKQTFITARLKDQQDMGVIGLTGDIVGSGLRMLHNIALRKECESRIKLLKKADVDLGDF